MKINVRVIPKSSREELVEVEGAFRAYVKAAPDKGKANKALIDLVAKKYKVKKIGNIPFLKQIIFSLVYYFSRSERKDHYNEKYQKYYDGTIPPVITDKWY